MVLMDAGGQYRDYSSNITIVNILSVSDKFTHPQRELYEASLNVQ